MDQTVRSQIWIAVSVYLLIAIIRKKLQLKASLYTLLQILSLSVFEKTPLTQVLSQGEQAHQLNPIDKQLNLFD